MLADPPVQVFICCADPDEDYRQALAQHLRGFLPEEAIGPRLPPGADRRIEVARQVQQAVVLVILESAALATAPFYDEVMVAQLRRRIAQRLPVIPVRLRPVQASAAGLGGLQAIPPTPETELSTRSAAEQDALWARVAAAVRQGLSAAWPETWGDALGAAVHLDRHRQWNALGTLCKGDQDQLILAYGRRHQGLGFFCQRAARFLSSARRPSEERPPPLHEVLTIPLWGEELRGEVAEDYEQFFRDALAGLTGKGVRAAAQVALAAKAQPLLLLLGREPLTEVSLEDEERSALGDFLGDLLPELLKQSRHSKRDTLGRTQPVRVLLAFEHDHPGLLPWAKEVEQRAAAAGLPVTFLDELALPAWAELQADLALYLRGDTELLKEFAGVYQRLQEAGRSFEDLTRVLDRKLKRTR